MAKNFSMGKKSDGKRVVQLRLEEIDALALVDLARMANTKPEQLVAYWTRRPTAELQARLMAAVAQPEPAAPSTANASGTEAEIEAVLPLAIEELPA